jgi:hypothetical protein
MPEYLSHGSDLSTRVFILLESFFTRDDPIMKSKPQEEQSLRKVQEIQKVNIGTSQKPKILNLGTTCTKDEVDQYVELFREFYDIFTWTYDDLKEYDKIIIQHIIPMKEGTKLVRHKPRIINPKLKPLVKLELEKM